LLLTLLLCLGLLALTALLVTQFLPRLASAQGMTWHDPMQITFTTGTTFLPEMAAGADGLLHVVCNDHEGYSPDHAYYRRSTDGGSSFSAGRQLDIYPHGWASTPAVAARGWIVHAVYEQHMPSGPNVKIAYRRSSDGGLHWERPIFLNHNACLPRVACQGDSVYVLYNIWQEPRHTRFRYSYNGGRTWSPEISLYPECVYPDMATSDGKVFVAYTQMESGVIEIYLRRSLDGGQSWQAPQPVSANPHEHSQDPQLAVQPGGLLAVSWFDYENSPMTWTGYIQCRVSGNYGQSFNPIQVVSSTYYCSFNDVALCDNQVHVAYTDERWGLDHSGIYYRQSPDGGANWLAEQALCADSLHSQEPSIVGLPDRAYVVWEKNQPASGYDLFFIAGSENPSMPLASCSETDREWGNLLPYPNPANPSTVICFKLQVPSFVNMAVYDVSGRLVTILVDGWREAGTHEVTFDGSGLASGIYMYRIQAGGWTAAGKMVLLK
jgi:hypothetical protein